MRNLRAVLLLRAEAVLWSLSWLLLLSVDDFTGLMVFELLGGFATALTFALLFDIECELA